MDDRASNAEAKDILSRLVLRISRKDIGVVSSIQRRVEESVPYRAVELVASTAVDQVRHRATMAELGRKRIQEECNLLYRLGICGLEEPARECPARCCPFPRSESCYREGAIRSRQTNTPFVVSTVRTMATPGSVVASE